MDKQITAHSYNRIPHINLKKFTDTRNNMDESQKHYVKRKKPDRKDYILYDFIYRKL